MSNIFLNNFPLSSGRTLGRHFGGIRGRSGAAATLGGANPSARRALCGYQGGGSLMWVPRGEGVPYVGTITGKKGSALRGYPI